MSSHEQQQTQILQTCQRINQMLQIPQEEFSLQDLTHIDWYMTVLQMIYPQLGEKFQQIKRIEDEAIAMDKLLFMLTQEEIIEEDFLEIKGQDIIEGDVQSVYYVVQLLNALIQREAEQQEGEGQDGQEQQQEQVHGQSEQPNEQHQVATQNTDQEQYSNDFEQAQSSTHSAQKFDPSQQIPLQSFSKPALNDPSMFKNVFNHYDSQDQPSHQEERHSVLGIQNQFQDQQDEDQQEQEELMLQQSSGGQNHGNNATFGQQKSNADNYLQQQSSFNRPNQTNNLQHQNQQKTQAELIATGYKMTQNQPQKKQFPSSSQQDINFYEQPSKKPKKQSKLQKSKQDTQEQDENEYFINPTIKKYKSDPKLLKTVGSGSKKSTTKKNVFKCVSPVGVSKKSRKLVSHPTIKKQYRKAVNPEAKKLTQQVRVQASTLLKKKKRSPQVSWIANPTATEMQRKRKEMKVKLADCKKDIQVREQQRMKSSVMQSRSNVQLGKILNWRQGQLKKQKQEFQKGMHMKLQVQKQGYIKKINGLLIKLQKEKQLVERQQYKEQLVEQNQEAAKRLTAIEQWYKDRIHMLKESNIQGRSQRKLMHTGHKEILKQIEKQLKRENQKQIMALTMKYRKQEAQVENDLQQLEREIIKVYKRN